MSNNGTIVQVIGPVVDVDFSDRGNCQAFTTPSKSNTR